jgi:hypothetical protein
MNRRPDLHHILFNKEEWSLRPEGMYLRNIPELVPRLDYNIHHDQLHRSCPAVPMLGYHALARVASRFKPVPGDTLASVDKLAISIESSLRHPKTHEIEREQGRLAIWALELQKPYLKEGIE